MNVRTLQSRPAKFIYWMVWIGLVLAVPTLPAVAAPDEDVASHPGYVDAAPFIRLAGGDDAIRMEVQLYGAALRILSKMPEPVGSLVKDLRSVRAVILRLDSNTKREKSREVLRDFDRRLRDQGWSRLAVVREENEEVNVMVREDGEEIVGLAVMIVDQSAGEFIFTNIVGKIDLDALQEFGKESNIPGLEHLGGRDE